MGKKYKLKTHKATAKRFRLTGSGKVVRTKGGKSHLRRRSSKRTKRQFDRSGELDPGLALQPVIVDGGGPA